jgi:hypothetical protein
MKAFVIWIAVILVPLTTSIHAETPPVDPTLPSVKPEALKALSDNRVRQKIMLESQAHYSGRCVCSYQTKDTYGRLCKGRHEVIKAEPQPICYPAQITRANPEKVESAIAATRSGLIQAACWLGGQQRWASPTRMT